MKQSHRLVYPLLLLTAPGFAAEAAVKPLHDYSRIVSHRIAVSEASAVAYNWDTDTLFSIGDEGEAVFQLTKTGATVDSMAFDYNVSPRSARGLDDPEGIAYLGNNTFMFADERDFMGRITTYEAGALRTQADLNPLSYSFDHLKIFGDTNAGLEGIAYDPVDKAIWGIKELDPLGVYRMVGVPAIDGAQGEVSVTEPMERRYITRWDTNLGVHQASDIYALAASAAFPPGHPRRMNLLLLSREMKLVLEISRTGTVIDTLDISSIGRKTIEGMTMDRDGVLYLVSEGNRTLEGSDPNWWSMLHVISPPEPVFEIKAHHFAMADAAITAELRWDSVVGENYIIEFSGDAAGNWQAVSATIPAAGSETSGFTQPIENHGKGFFRVRRLDP